MATTSRAPVRAATFAFWAFHLGLVGIFFIPADASALALVLGSYFGRMFFITAGYHRYFSHRAFSTSRTFQFVLAFMALTSSQKGVLWWSAHHRAHHRHSDGKDDVHTPLKGFLWSHCGWFLSPDHEGCNEALVKDLARYPELRFLERNWALPVALYGLVLLAFGGWSAVYWGLFVSTVLLWHGTFTINSLSHLWGSRRYSTKDLSRNNPILAIITLGEGWHNNHHRYPGAAKNGFLWWEIDPTYYALKALSLFKLVWGLRPVPEAVSAEPREPLDRTRPLTTPWTSFSGGDPQAPPPQSPPPK